jgi:hypothetical protein
MGGDHKQGVVDQDRHRTSRDIACLLDESSFNANVAKQKVNRPLLNSRTESGGVITGAAQGGNVQPLIAQEVWR